MYFGKKQKSLLCIHSAWWQNIGVFTNVTCNTQSKSPNIDLGGCFLALNASETITDSVTPSRIQIRLLSADCRPQGEVASSSQICDLRAPPLSFWNLTYA